jgi:hypothetical protein
MDEIVFPESYEGVTSDDLTSLRTEANAALLALVEADSPSDDDVTEAERLGAGIDALDAELASRAAVDEERAAKVAALREKFTTAEPEADPDEAAPEEDTPDVPDEEPEPEPAVPNPEAAVKPSARTALAKRTPRPQPPATGPSPVLITAAADVPEFATGSQIETMTKVGVAMINRMRGFGIPTGDGTSENLQHYGVATFRPDYPETLTIDRGRDDQEVMTYAANEHRLPGGSLVAAGGWCAPSETLYDLCPGGSMDGLLSIPEIAVNRGGLKYTKGPDFSALYTAGFCQTEAQAIAGTTKPCYEVPCPPFVEVRLDACGICIKVPILTNAAYPELVSATLSEAMVAFAHSQNARTIGAIATAAGTALAPTGLGAVSSDTLEALLILGDNIRQKKRLPLSESMEVVLPFWAKDVIKSDLFRRNGCCNMPSDSDVAAIFAAANTNVQYVYDWNPLPDASVAWPATMPALVYPAGSYVKGVAPVISLNAVYDAASLAVNVYTGLFFEQGVLVAEMCNKAVAATIPVCTAGRTGAADLACA